MIESAGAGYDACLTEVDYALPANVEQLVLTGTDNLDAVANALDDTLVGNAGDNRFTVGPGADRIIGGAGIDTVVFSGNRANYAILFDAPIRRLSRSPICAVDRRTASTPSAASNSSPSRT